MRVAMGELGWPPSEAYWCDVNAILVARGGQTDLLCRIGLLQRTSTPATPIPPRDARGHPDTFEAAFDRRFPAAPPRRVPRRSGRHP